MRMINDERSHLGLEMHLSATSDDSLTHILNDTWQFVGTYMWMCIGKNVCACSMLAEHIQDFIRIAAFLRACIELTIGIGTSPTLAKTVIALTINLLSPGDIRQILLAIVNILTTFQNNGSQTEFYES